MYDIASSNKDITQNIIQQLPKEEISIGGIKDKSLILNFEGGNVGSDDGSLLLR